MGRSENPHSDSQGTGAEEDYIFTGAVRPVCGIKATGPPGRGGAPWLLCVPRISTALHLRGSGSDPLTEEEKEKDKFRCIVMKMLRMS